MHPVQRSLPERIESGGAGHCSGKNRKLPRYHRPERSVNEGAAGGRPRRIGDYITVRPDPSLPRRLPLSPPLVFRYFNGDHASFRGYRFSARYRAARGLEVRFQGAKTIADDNALR